MTTRPTFPRAALLEAAMATATSVVALALVAVGEGKSALRPLNATSHWRNGDGAAAVERFDGTHTAVGVATHAAATLFWAVPFALWNRVSPPPGTCTVAIRATAISALAALVDYCATPKRFTPGWELVLSRGAMAVVYAAMAAGLTLGSLLAARSGGDANG